MNKTIKALDCLDSTWVQATSSTSTSDSSLYAEFLKSIKERDEKVNAYVISAFSFLHKEGYITKEEYETGESERLNDIRTYDKAGGMNIMLLFDDDEWALSVMINDMFKVTKVFLIESEKETQILYEC